MDFWLTCLRTHTQVEKMHTPPAPKMLSKLSFTFTNVAFVILDWEKGRKDVQRKQKPNRIQNH